MISATAYDPATVYQRTTPQAPPRHLPSNIPLLGPPANKSEPCSRPHAAHVPKTLPAPATPDVPSPPHPMLEEGGTDGKPRARAPCVDSASTVHSAAKHRGAALEQALAKDEGRGGSPPSGRRLENSREATAKTALLDFGPLRSSWREWTRCCRRDVLCSFWRYCSLLQPFSEGQPRKGRRMRPARGTSGTIVHPLPPFCGRGGRTS